MYFAFLLDLNYFLGYMYMIAKNSWNIFYKLMQKFRSNLYYGNGMIHSTNTVSFLLIYIPWSISDTNAWNALIMTFVKIVSSRAKPAKITKLNILHKNTASMWVTFSVGFCHFFSSSLHLFTDKKLISQWKLYFWEVPVLTNTLILWFQLNLI